MASKSLTLKAMRASAEAQVPPRLGLRIVILFVVLQVLLLLAVSFLFPSAARAEMMKGDISVNTAGGYARLVFTFAQENDADVRLANGSSSSPSRSRSIFKSTASRPARCLM